MALTLTVPLDRARTGRSWLARYLSVSDSRVGNHTVHVRSMAQAISRAA